jgi:hypothetical protein
MGVFIDETYDDGVVLVEEKFNFLTFCESRVELSTVESLETVELEVKTLPSVDLACPS